MSTITQIRRRFKSSIRRGTGEAILLMQQNPDVDFSLEIIGASLKNVAYDPQFEGSRAPYLFELISMSKQVETIRKAILVGLEKEQTDTYTLTQLFALAKLFAIHGDKASKEAIYKKFITNNTNCSDWPGYAEIMDLDGIEGLKFIAEKFGENLQKNRDDWQDDSIIRHFQENNPGLDVYQLLDEASLTNPFIKTYLNGVRQNEEDQKNHQEEKIVYSNIIDEVLMSKRKRFYKTLTDSELNLIAQRLLLENDEPSKEKLLAVFGRNKFPLDSEFILKLAIDKSSTIADLAIDALKHLSGDNIRKFALANIDRTRRPGAFVKILKTVYKDGDEELLTNLVKKFRSEPTIESLAISYADIFRWNHTTKCKRPLEAIYNKSTCGICRKNIVEILLANNVLSEQIEQEIRFDCNTEIRQLVNIDPVA